MAEFIDLSTLERDMWIHVCISFFVWILVVLAIFIDLWDRIYTNKKTGQRICSHKMRKTMEKICEYWRPLAIAFLIDSIGLLVPFYVLPFVTLLLGAGLIITEGKSMYEHSKERKSKIAELKDIYSLMVQCASHQDAREILSKVIDYMEDSKEKKKEEQRNKAEA